MSSRTKADEEYIVFFPNLRRVIVRVYWASLPVVLVLLAWPSPLVDRWWAIPVIGAVCVAAGVVGPRLLDRYRRSRRYLAVLVAGAAALGVLIRLTGSGLSPFWGFYLVMMALVASLFPPRRAIPGVVLIALASFLPLLWRFDAVYLRQAIINMVFYAFLAHFVSLAATRLTQERRQRDHLARLAEVSRTATGLDLNATLQGAAENLVAATDAHSGVIFFREDERLRPRVVVLSPSLYTEKDFEAIHRFSLHPGEGLVGWVAERGEPILTGDAWRDSRHVPVPGVAAVEESALVVPMQVDRKTIGVIHLSRLGADQFDEEDLSLVRIMTDQTAVAVENARLYEQTQNRAARLFTLSEVTRASQSSLDPAVLLPRVEAELARFFTFDRLAVGLLDPTGRYYHVFYENGGVKPQTSDPAEGAPVVGSILEWMVRENRPYWEPELTEHVVFPEDQRFVEMGLRSVIRAPLWALDQVIGIFSMSCQQALAYAKEDADLLGDIARVVGLALHQARTYQELRERVAQVEVMSHIALAASSSLNLMTVAQTLRAEAQRLLPFHRLQVLLVDEAAGTFEELGGAAGSAEGSGPLAGTAVEWLVHHREPLLEADLQREARFGEDHEALQVGMRSCLRVPLEAAGQLIGALVLSHATPDIYTAHELEMAVQVGQQAAMALNNARLFAEMERLATTDPLTGLYNRRSFHMAWNDASHEAQEEDRPVSLLMIDINNFKGYNDHYGHLAGDQLLQEVAQIMQQQVRASDVVARYGGDEFVVLMPDTAETQARRVKERIERAVTTRNALAAGEGQPLVLDIGVESAQGAALERLLARADAAMYKAKESKDRRQLRAVVAASEQERQRLALQTVLSLAKIEEMKDAYTRGHSERLRDYAVEVGKELGLPPAELQNLSYGAMLHDIGKVAMPSHILHKPDGLTEEEQRIMRMHPILGEAMIADVELLQGARPIIRHHQERYDGITTGDRPGYPEGLAGEEIPLGARIIAVVDAYDAMTTDRPYRKGVSQEEALDELRRHAGSQFDSNVVRTFEQLLRHGRLEQVGEHEEAHD
ncbi:MAG: diguanylate cyclase [Symbiobacteriia bacterium]